MLVGCDMRLAWMDPRRKQKRLQGWNPVITLVILHRSADMLGHSPCGKGSPQTFPSSGNRCASASFSAEAGLMVGRAT